MSFQERPITFDCEADRLVGVLALPEVAAAAKPLALVVVVGGPQYRVGSHRQFVELTRCAAAAGFAALRFDVRGMGDSTGEQRSFEALTPDVQAAINATLAQVPAAQGVVLMGLCDGASAALMYVHDTRDARVAGLCLLNPWARSEQSLAQTQVKHYYVQRLSSKAFWLKLLRGGVGLGALAGFAAAVRKIFGGAAADGAAQDGAARRGGRQGLPFRAAMLRGWRAFDGPIALALSGEDLTAKEFSGVAMSDPDWRACLARANVTHCELQAADHTLSGPGQSRRFNEFLLTWLAQMPMPSMQAPFSNAFDAKV